MLAFTASVFLGRRVFGASVWIQRECPFSPFCIFCSTDMVPFLHKGFDSQFSRPRILGRFSFKMREMMPFMARQPPKEYLTPEKRAIGRAVLFVVTALAIKWYGSEMDMPEPNMKFA